MHACSLKGCETDVYVLFVSLLRSFFFFLPHDGNLTDEPMHLQEASSRPQASKQTTSQQPSRVAHESQIFLHPSISL